MVDLIENFILALVTIGFPILFLALFYFTNNIIKHDRREYNRRRFRNL